MDEIDRALIPRLQEDAGRPYAASVASAAGSASVGGKARTATTEQPQDVLGRPYAIDGVSGAQAVVALETFFERPLPL